MKVIGWISGLLLGICALPEVFHTIQKGQNTSSIWFLILWGLGELGFFIYVFPKRDYPLLFNYVLNIILISILLKYNLFPI